MKTENEILEILAHCTGTTRYHRVSSFPDAPIVTDGIIALAEAAGCYWLLDVIISHQTNRKLDPSFQVWELTKNKKGDGAIVRGYNDKTKIVSQRIPFTDFPLDGIKLYLMEGVIMLPSEY